MKNVIYKLTSPSGKSYIGLTNNFKKRMKEHEVSQDTCAIHCAIRKYGFENFKKEILKEVRDPNLLLELEIFYIEKFDTFNDGYNLTLGGEGSYGRECTKETREKISRANTGHIHSKEAKLKMSNKLKGRIFSEEHKEKLSERSRGKNNGMYGRSRKGEKLGNGIKAWETRRKRYSNG